MVGVLEAEGGINEHARAVEDIILSVKRFEALLSPNLFFVLFFSIQ